MPKNFILHTGEKHLNSLFTSDLARSQSGTQAKEGLGVNFAEVERCRKHLTSSKLVQNQMGATSLYSTCTKTLYVPCKNSSFLCSLVRSYSLNLPHLH